MALPNDGELSVRGLQIEALIPAGNESEFTDLAELYDIGGYNPSAPSNIILADSFYGETLNLTATSITITPTTLSLPNNGGGTSQYTNINVSSDGSFLIVNKPNWIGIDDSYYTSGGTIRIYRFDNSALGSPERSATLEFRGTGGITRRTLSITQAGNPIELTLNPSTSQTLSRTASTLTQDVTVTNPLVVTGTVVGDGMTLSSPSVTNLGSTSIYRFTLSYTTNDTTSTREAVITFNITGDTFSDVRIITHTQTRLVPSLSIATSTLSFVQGGETKFFDVVSNTDWTSDITGTGFEQSLSSTSGFTTSNLSGNSNDRIYINALVNEETSPRNGNVRVEVDGGSPFDTVSLSQAAFVETLSIATSLLSFNSSGETEFFDVVSNTDWTSDISGTGYQQSFSSTSGFTTSNLSGNGNDRVYIRIAENTGTSTRNGSVSVAVLDGSPSDSVSFSQNPKPIWTDADILISGFDVDEFGDISVPTITTTGNIAYTTTYTDGISNVTAAAGFPLVGENTPRYVQVTVTVPSAYRNPGSYTKTVSAVQEERFYGSDEISISGFSVDADGVVTQPTVSATGVLASNITVTYDGGASVLTKGYPLIGSAATRTVTATVTIPSGWFNSGEQSRSATDVQEAAILTGWIYYPYNSTAETREIGGIPLPITTTYTYDDIASTAIFQFSVRTNFTTPFIVTEFGSGVLYEYGGLNSVSSVTFDSQVDGISPYQRHFEVRVPIPGPGGSNVSTVNVRPTGFSGYNTEFDIVVNRGSTPTVSPTVESTVLPTVRPKPQI